jgi:murein DD-endopeptidase MepM/ murein hydrolase activator NlpD
MPDPLKFTFPTAQADSVSSWRAPLYPVPWEPTPNDHFYFTRPIGANEVNWPLARYRYGYLLYAEPHSGIDIPAPNGTPILAAGPGTVVWAGYGLYFQRDIEEDPYGIAVAIKHDFGYKGQLLYTVYGHMSETIVYRGQRVQAGETLGMVGETGRTSGPHLHFEVRVGDDTYFTIRNPELWISPPQGAGVLVGRITQYNGDKAPGVRLQLRSTEGKGNFDVISYAENDVNSDEYYNENLVLGDIPAGHYALFFDFKGEIFRQEMDIFAGRVNFFSYRYKGDLVLGPPPTPEDSFVPPDATATAATQTAP